MASHTGTIPKSTVDPRVTRSRSKSETELVTSNDVSTENVDIPVEKNSDTRFKRRLECIIRALEIYSHHFESLKVDELSSRALANAYLHEFKCGLHSAQVEALDCLENIQSSIERCEFHETILELTNIMTRNFELFVRPHLHDPNSNTPNAVDPPKDNLNELKLFTLLLPNVPVFQGDVTLFPSFLTSFNEAVHLRSLPVTQKMTALRQKLAGNALRLIENLGASPEDYQIAYNTLIEHFSGTYRIASALHDRFLNIVPLAKESMAELERMVAEMSTTVGAIDNLNLEDAVGFLRFHIMFNKLPNNMRDEFYESYVIDRNGLPSYTDLCQYLSNRLSILRARPQPLSKAASNQHCPSRVIPSAPSSLRYNRPYAASDPKFTRQNLPRGCYLCNESHLLYHCKAFQDLRVPDRVLFVKDRKLCMNCFSPNHDTQNCPSTRSCTYCSQKHHSFVHHEGVNLPQQPAGARRSPFSKSIPNNERSKPQSFYASPQFASQRYSPPPSNLSFPSSSPLQENHHEPLEVTPYNNSTNVEWPSTLTSTSN